MVGLLLTCVRDGRCTARDVTNNPAATASSRPRRKDGRREPRLPRRQPVEPSVWRRCRHACGGRHALPALPTLADGTNCWWIAEGRSPADADMDGMPDAWERIFGLDPLDRFDAANDHDHEQADALEEFLNRTHPRRRDTNGDSMPCHRGGGRTGLPLPLAAGRHPGRG